MIFTIFGVVEHLGRIVDRCIRSVLRELGVVVGDGAPVLLAVIRAELEKSVVAVLGKVVVSKSGEKSLFECIPVCKLQCAI